jgi:hypothetical protein
MGEEFVMLFNKPACFFFRHAHLSRQSLGSAPVLAPEHNGLEPGTFDWMRGLCCVRRHSASQLRRGKVGVRGGEYLPASPNRWTTRQR